MRLVVTVEARFARTPDGCVWSPTAPTHRDFAGYARVFDEVRVVARVRDVAGVPDGARRVDGERVHVWPLPYYVGPGGYLARWAELRRAVRAAASPGDAVLLRLPSPAGALLAADRSRAGLPYAVQVVGDPYDVFAPGVVRHPLRPLLRRHFTRQLRGLCAGASAVAYVTSSALRDRYPPASGATTASFSNVLLDPAAFVPSARLAPREPGRYALVSVGSLDQRYKGIDTLVTALALLRRGGVPADLTHVGDGRYRPELERLADRLGVAERMVFAGALPPGPEVRTRLDAADLFVLPSRTEGLPRALIEAMARGLPAVASRVGGVPELLGPDCLVPPGDATALAARIRGLLGDRGAYATAAGENLRRSREYAAPVMAARADAFCTAVAALSRVDRPDSRAVAA